VKKIFLFTSLLFVAAQLVGCAGNVRPQDELPTVNDSGAVPRPEDQLPEKPAEPVIPPPVAPRVPTPVVPNASSNATASLVSQARAQYQAKNYQGAVATAERALRIDRRSPEVYLVLAQSYVQLANKQLAMQFAQQGIRYSQAGTDLAKNLAQIRDSLSK
jgi:tetratricopeptide (TPR) repeat protein